MNNSYKFPTITPETETLVLEIIQRLRAQWMVMTKPQEQTIREVCEAVVGKLQYERDEARIGHERSQFDFKNYVEQSAIKKSDIKADLDEARETINIQHRLMKTAEQRGIKKATEEHQAECNQLRKAWDRLQAKYEAVIAAYLGD